MSSCVRILGPETNCDDPVARAFMGANNIDALNAEMIHAVFESSNGQYRIGKQSQLELATIMRSVYLTEARHLPGNVPAQVARLNQSVLSYAVPVILSEVEMHNHYMKDRDQANRGVAPRTIMASTTGARAEVSAQDRPFFAPQ